MLNLIKPRNNTNLQSPNMPKSFKTKKSLGQHILIDPNIIRKITDSIPAEKNDLVVEIGPGTGALTRELAERFHSLLLIEIDRRAVEVLQEKFPGIQVQNEDVLKTDWHKITSGYDRVHVVGNLPYFITSQILFSVMEARNILNSLTFMMQKEVAERIVACPHTKEYGILSVQLQLFSNPEILFDVSPHVFRPKPKVWSSVVQFTFNKKQPECSDENLKKIVRTAFNQRRKKLSNALKSLDVELPDGEFDFDKRAGAWTPQMYAKLTARLEQLGTIN